MSFDHYPTESKNYPKYGLKKRARHRNEAYFGSGDAFETVIVQMSSIYHQQKIDKFNKWSVVKFIFQSLVTITMKMIFSTAGALIGLTV